jgi:hypothetical protein
VDETRASPMIPGADTSIRTVRAFDGVDLEGFRNAVDDWLDGHDENLTLGISIRA